MSNLVKISGLHMTTETGEAPVAPQNCLLKIKGNCCRNNCLDDDGGGASDKEHLLVAEIIVCRT